MPVLFLISITKIHDPKRYQTYVEQVKPIIEQYGGRYTVESDHLLKSRDWEAEKIVILEFASEEKMNACFSSQAYQRVSHLREGAIESSFIALNP